MAEWYYESDQGRQGPFTSREFRELASSGAIKPETLVWKAGLERPVRASRIKGLEFVHSGVVVAPSPPTIASSPKVPAGSTEASTFKQIASRRSPALRYAALLSVIGAVSVGAYIIGARASGRNEPANPPTSNPHESHLLQGESVGRATTNETRDIDLSWATAYPNRVTEASLTAQARKLLGQRVAISVSASVKVESDTSIMLGPVPIVRSWSPELFTALLNFDGTIDATCGGVCRVEVDKFGKPQLVIDPAEFLITGSAGGGVLPRASIRGFVGKLVDLGGASRPESLATKLCRTSWKPKNVFGKPVNEIQDMTMRMWFYPNGECKCSDILRTQYQDEEGLRWMGASYWRLHEANGAIGLAMFATEPRQGVKFDIFSITIDDRGALAMEGPPNMSKMEWIDATSH